MDGYIEKNDMRARLIGEDLRHILLPKTKKEIRRDSLERYGKNYEEIVGTVRDEVKGWWEDNRENKRVIDEIDSLLANDDIPKEERDKIIDTYKSDAMEYLEYDEDDWDEYDLDDLLYDADISIVIDMLESLLDECPKDFQDIFWMDLGTKLKNRANNMGWRHKSILDT